MASKGFTVRLSEENYNYIQNIISSGEYKTFSEFVQRAVTKYINSLNNTPFVIYPESENVSSLKSELSIYKSQVQEKDIQISKIHSQLSTKDEQLKIKDQQIFSLLMIQKDLMEKTTEQVKLLGDQIKSKKWYQFWK